LFTAKNLLKSLRRIHTQHIHVFWRGGRDMWSAESHRRVHPATQPLHQLQHHSCSLPVKQCNQIKSCTVGISLVAW